jgi:hypothetical protein
VMAAHALNNVVGLLLAERVAEQAGDEAAA